MILNIFLIIGIVFLLVGIMPSFFVSKPNYSIKEECRHPNRITRVLEYCVNCETTVEVCADCDKFLTEPKTDCR